MRVRNRQEFGQSIGWGIQDARSRKPRLGGCWLAGFQGAVFTGSKNSIVIDQLF
jgi:hypothetical protein